MLWSKSRTKGKVDPKARIIEMEMEARIPAVSTKGSREPNGYESWWRATIFYIAFVQLVFRATLNFDVTQYSFYTIVITRFSSVGVSWALAIQHSAPDPGSNPGWIIILLMFMLHFYSQSQLVTRLIVVQADVCYAKIHSSFCTIARTPVAFSVNFASRARSSKLSWCSKPAVRRDQCHRRECRCDKACLLMQWLEPAYS